MFVWKEANLSNKWNIKLGVNNIHLSGLKLKKHFFEHIHFSQKIGKWITLSNIIRKMNDSRCKDSSSRKSTNASTEQMYLFENLMPNDSY